MSWSAPVVLAYLVFSGFSIIFSIAALFKVRLPKVVLSEKSGPFLLIACGLWLSLEVFGRLAGSVEETLLFDRLEVTAALSTTFAWIAYVGELYKRKLKGYRLSLSIAALCLFAGIVITSFNPYHHLLWKPAENPDLAKGIIKVYRPGFFVLMATITVPIIWGLVQLVRLTLKAVKDLSTNVRLFAVFTFVPATIALLEYFLSLRLFGELRAAPFLLALSIWLRSWFIYVNKRRLLIQTSRKNVLENMNDPVFVVDGYNRLIDINKSALDLFGVEESQSVLGKGIGEVWNDGANLVAPKAAESEIIQIADKTLEPMVSVIRDGRGDVVSRIFGLRDITESKTAEAELQRYARELQNRNDELQQFAYVASHDLQEPLRMVSSYLGLLKRKYGDKMEHLASVYIEIAVDGAHRMEKLLTDLLTFSRIGTREEVIEQLQLNDIVEEVKVKLRPVIDQHEAQIKSHPLPTVSGDRANFLKLFENLIDNGVRYHTAGKVPEIEVAGRKGKNKVLLWVKDNGIGVEKAQHHRIFQVFQRLHTIEEFDGSGVGLAICKRVIERRGGKIWVESEEGEGATFFVSLPVRDKAQ